MNNTGHALATNDIEAIRKAQQEWRLQKRRELEAKARKKQFRLSTTVAAQSHQKFPQSPSSPSLSSPIPIAPPRPTAQPVYTSHINSTPPTIPASHHTPSFYAANTTTQDPVTSSASQESVAQQVLRQKAIQQQTQLQQMEQARQGILSQQVRMHRLFQTPREHDQNPIASAALITTSPGVSIQPQPPYQYPSARPVAPRPSLPNDINMKNAIAAATVAANAASAAVATRTQLDGKAATVKAADEAVAAAAAAAHAAANASAGDSQYAAMLPSNVTSVSAAKSTQEAVEVAAAAAAAAASAAIPASSAHVVKPVDEVTRIKLEQLEAQRRWREEKRREIALKRAKGAGSKRGRKRTKLVHSSPTAHEQVTNHSAVAATATGMSSPTATSLPGLGGSVVPFSTSVASSVPGTQSLSMSSAMQSQLTAVQLGVQGGFLTANQSSVPASSAGMPTNSAAVVNEGHLTAEDAAAMYVQMAGAGAGGTSLPMESSNTAIPLASAGGQLVHVDVVQGGEAEVEVSGVPDVEIPGANTSGAGNIEESTVEAVAQGDTTETEITKATEAAAVAVAGVSEDTGADMAQDASMADMEDATAAGEEGDEATGADGDDAAQPVVGGNDTGSEAGQQLSRRERDENGGQQEQAKDTTDASQADMPDNVEVSEIVAEDEDIKGKESGNEGVRDDQGVILEAVDRDSHGVDEAHEADANEESQVGHNSVERTGAKDDEDGPQDRFQEDGGEDIMTAAAWQSLDSINP